MLTNHESVPSYAKFVSTDDTVSTRNINLLLDTANNVPQKTANVEKNVNNKSVLTKAMEKIK